MLEFDWISSFELSMLLAGRPLPLSNELPACDLFLSKRLWCQLTQQEPALEQTTRELDVCNTRLYAAERAKILRLGYCFYKE
jgi:hypothetical protein